jgi:hypothetical protein
MSLESFNAHKTQEGVPSPDESDKPPEQLLADLEAEKEGVTEEIGQLRGTLDNVDQSKLTEDERSLWEKISSVASDAKRFVEDFVSDHPRLTLAAGLIVSLASAYLMQKGIDAQGVLTSVREGSEYVLNFIPNPGSAASALEIKSLVLGEGLSAMAAAASLTGLLTSVFEGPPWERRRERKEY